MVNFNEEQSDMSSAMAFKHWYLFNVENNSTGPGGRMGIGQLFWSPKIKQQLDRKMAITD